MKKIIILIAFSVSTYSALPQMDADSLQRILNTAKTDTVTLSRYLSVLVNLPPENMDAGFVLGEWLSKHALNAKAYKTYTTARLAMASIYHFHHIFVPAITNYVEAQTYAEKYALDELRLETINNLANVYFLSNQFDKAEQLYLETVEACKKLDIKIGLIAGYGSLGSIYYSTSGNDLSKERKAVAFMMMAAGAAEAIKDTAQLIQSWSGISKMYSGMGMGDSALFWVNKSGALMDAKKNNQEGFGYHYLHLGYALIAKKDYKAAIENFLTGLGHTKKMNAPLWESSHYEGLSKAYEAVGDYHKALYYGRLHFKIEDSVLGADNFARAADIQNIYERKRKDNQLLQKDLDLKTASQKKAKLTAFLVSSLVVLVLLGIFTALLMKNIRARKKAYTLLEEKNTKIQEQGLELSKQAKLIAKFQSQMNPHFVFNALHNIQGLVLSDQIQKATSQIQSLAQLMRKTFSNAEKDDIPLEEEINYLEKYIDFEQNAFDNRLRFEIKTGEHAENVLIPPMMIQPFVENAIKHAQLKKVENPYIKVLIEIENNLLSICVTDNGAGMKKEEISTDILSHSMSVIKARLQLLFQEKNKPVNENLFIVKTVPDIAVGTMVKFYLPLNYAY